MLPTISLLVNHGLGNVIVHRNFKDKQIVKV